MRNVAVEKVPEMSRSANRHSFELGLVDELTGLLNGDALRFLGDYQARLAMRTGRPFALLHVEVMGLDEGGDKSGVVGEEALRETAELLLTTFRASDVCARLDETEFAVLLSEVSRARIGPQIARLRLLELLERHDGDGGPRSKITLRTGVSSFEPGTDASFDDLLARARGDGKAMSVTVAQKRAEELAVSTADIRLSATR